MKFEVGKKYMIEGYNKPSTYIGPSSCGAVFENEHACLQSYSFDNKITEYKEPKRGTATLLIRESPDGKIVFVDADGDLSHINTTLAKIEVQWVEGQGL
jgi:hypothetical protein